MNSVKILILAKQIDGGTGTFLKQFNTIVQQFPDCYTLKFSVLDRPMFRSVKDFFVSLSFYHDHGVSTPVYRIVPSAIWRVVLEHMWVSKQCGNFQPDIIVTIDMHCAFLGCMYKLFHPKVKLVLTMHNNVRAVTFRKLTSAGRTVMYFLCQKMFSLADVVVGVSHGVSSDVQQLFHLRCVVQTIYYGVRPSAVFRRKRNNIARFPTVLSIGRLEPQKDFVTVIKAVYKAKHRLPNLRLIILGDGRDRLSLERLVTRLGMTKYISFAGWGAAVGPYFAQADVFVLSSHYEGFPYVLLEAMQYGLPIIATDTPYGPSEALHDGKAGVLVTPADFPALANAMIRLAQNTALYEQMRNASFTQARYFSEEKMLSAYNRVFRSLVE